MTIVRQMGEFERWASGIASTAIGSWAVRRGGVIGLVALAGAGYLAWRAGKGQSLLPEGMQRSFDPSLPAPEPKTRTGAARRASPAKARMAKAAGEATKPVKAPAPRGAAKLAAHSTTKPTKVSAKNEKAAKPARAHRSAKPGPSSSTTH